MKKMERTTQKMLNASKQKRSLTALIENAVEEYHPAIRRQLAWLKQTFAMVIQVHDHEYPDLVPAYLLFLHLSDDLEKHMVKEESVIFPYLVKAEKSVSQGQRLDSSVLKGKGGDDPLQIILWEHEATQQDWAELKKLTSGFVRPKGACTYMDALYWGLQRLERVLNEHLESEVNDLYRQVDEENWFMEKGGIFIAIQGGRS